MRKVSIMERIFECERQARTAPNPRARVAWKQLENFWRDRIEMPEPTRSFDQLDATGLDDLVNRLTHSRS